jgi:RND family efflux transporter MFP subunit
MKIGIPAPLQKIVARPTRLLAGVGVVAVVVLGVIWLVGRSHAASDRSPAASPSPSSMPTVGVAKVGREDLFQPLTIYAEFRPFLEVTLHAKVSGYLSQINVDFGDLVKSNQLLATLDAPDLVAQLNNAIATERKAEAAYANAHTNHVRLSSVNKVHPNLVAEQDLDNADALDRTTFAAIAAARAERQKFETLVGYMKITAPFDGVITKRFADPGALIQAGTTSDTQSMPLVRISDNYRLRMDFYVSVDDVKDIHPGDSVDVIVDSLGGRKFTGTISRVTDRVEEDTRQMMCEIEVSNPKLELVPGMYARAFLKVQRRPNVVAVPTEAVATDTSDKTKNTVYVVNQNHEIEERTVTLGLETPTRWEVLSGLQEGDLVMIGPRSEVRPGEKVEINLVGALLK